MERETSLGVLRSRIKTFAPADGKHRRQKGCRACVLPASACGSVCQWVGGLKKGTPIVCPLSCNESTINACARCRCLHGRLRRWPRRGRRTCRGKSCFPSTCCRLPNCHGANCRPCGHCCCGCHPCCRRPCTADPSCPPNDRYRNGCRCGCRLHTSLRCPLRGLQPATLSWPIYCKHS